LKNGNGELNEPNWQIGFVGVVVVEHLEAQGGWDREALLHHFDRAFRALELESGPVFAAADLEVQKVPDADDGVVGADIEDLSLQLHAESLKLVPTA